MAVPQNMKIPVEDLTRQWTQIAPEIMEAVGRVLPKGKYTLGPELSAFESEFAAYSDCAYGIGISSGTAALHLGLKACGVGPGDEVITVCNTYVATAFAITYTGATPVFVDVDPDTFNIDVAKIEAKITPRTKAILPVHIYGQIANMEDLVAMARKHNLRVVEDCAHTHGAARNGKKAGSFGDVGCYSFYPTKVIGAFGDGGFCATNDPELNAKIRQLRYMGQRTKYNHEIVGHQERLDELQAAMLRVKLRYLPGWLEGRRRAASMYDELLTGLPVVTPKVDPENYHVYYMYCIRAQRRDELMQYLLDNGIGCYIVYPYLVPLTGAYQARGERAESYPVAAAALNEILCLPMFPELTDDEVHQVSDTVKAFYAKH